MPGEEGVICCCSGCFIAVQPCPCDIGAPLVYITCEDRDAIGAPFVFQVGQVCYDVTGLEEELEDADGIVIQEIGSTIPDCDTPDGIFCCCNCPPPCWYILEPCQCIFGWWTPIIEPFLIPCEFVDDNPLVEVGDCVTVLGPQPECWEENKDVEVPWSLDQNFCYHITASKVTDPTGACVVVNPTPFEPTPGGCNAPVCCEDENCCGLNPCNTAVCRTQCPCCVTMVVDWIFVTNTGTGGATCCCDTSGNCPSQTIAQMCFRPPPGASCTWWGQPEQCGFGCDDSPHDCCYDPCTFFCGCSGQNESCNQCVGCGSAVCGTMAIDCIFNLPANIITWTAAVNVAGPGLGFDGGTPCCHCRNLQCNSEGGAPCFSTCLGSSCRSGAAWERVQTCGEWTGCPPSTGWIQTCFGVGGGTIATLAVI